MKHGKRYIVFGLLLLGGAILADEGAVIYKKRCLECHGARGEGVEDEVENPLYGDKSMAQLAKLIHKTMPDDDPKLCRGEDAEKVARYIYDAFYSREARRKLNPARIEFARLTVRQFEQSVADLIADFIGFGNPGDKKGLKASYYNGRSHSDKKKVFDRTDAQVQFDFGTNSPQKEKFGRDAFAIKWEGSVIADESGEYEFVVKSENGFQFWLNDLEKPLVDGYVASGGKPQSYGKKIRLLGGRAYPVRLQFFKWKDKTASIELRWKPPHKVEALIPERNLMPRHVPPTLILATPFPPDDGSVGYPRGTSVSKAWDRAATYAAIEVAGKVALHLDRLSKSKKTDADRKEKVKRFCEHFAERAFRRPLTDEQRKFFIEAQLNSTEDEVMAIKRFVLLVLKSPRFLYPEIKAGKPDTFTVASRMALGLWDSIPDQALFQSASQNYLQKPNQVEQQAKRMLKDPRTKSKLNYFFHHWLRMDEAEDIAKDTDLFPGFNNDVIADLRTSLDLFLDDVVWSDQSDYRKLLLADYMFMNNRLASFYKVDRPADERFQKVSFDPNRRSGVVTHPYLLSTFAYRTSTSPIHRGVFLTRNMLGRSLKPPPEATIFKDSRFDPKLTMREKVTELTKPANCQTCHSVINPLGFSLEHYDAVGRYRTHEKDLPIDASGKLPTDDGKTVELKGARDLARYAAESESAQRGFIIQLFNQVAKQPIQAYGAGRLDELHKTFTASSYNIQKLLVEMIKISALHGVKE